MELQFHPHQSYFHHNDGSDEAVVMFENAQCGWVLWLSHALQA